MNNLKNKNITDIKVWIELDKEIKAGVYKNGLTPDKILKPVRGELKELAIKTSYGWETLFYGNGEAFITVDVNGMDYEFSYVIDSYGEEKYFVNF